MSNKTIFIKDIVNNTQYELSVNVNLKISELKIKIENTIGRKIMNKLCIKHKHRKVLTQLLDENLTISEAHIKNEDIIILGKEI